MTSPQPTDFRKLVSELSQWNNGNGIDIDSWLGFKGNYELAIAFSRLFWPEFVEHDGCVFFAGFSLESFRGFMAQCNGDRASVEQVMNHRHLLDIFHHAADTATLDQLTFLGTVLRETWRAKLARDFPSRSFEVTFDHADADDLLEYFVAFCQPTNWPGS